MTSKSQLSLTASLLLSVLALFALASTAVTPRGPLEAAITDEIESIARTQQRLLNDRARLSRGEGVAPNRWFEAASAIVE